MKKYFGEYRFRLKAAAKKQGIPWRDVYLNAQRAGWGRSERELELLFNAEWRILNGEGTHFLIESPELAQKLMELGKIHDVRLLDILADEGLALGIIHTCGAATAALFYWHTKDRETLLTSDSDISQCAFSDEFVKANGLDPAGMEKAAQLLFGLALYMNCFPNAVRDGLPDFVKHPAHYKGKKCAGINEVPEFIDRSGPRPHFRSGHFRVLSSEKFTTKRWQVIFVKGAFVKGNAKTIQEVE